MKSCDLQKCHLEGHLYGEREWSGREIAGLAVQSRGARNGLERLDTDPILVSLHSMITDITSKTLHEKTGQVLDRLRRGERFRVIRDGEPEGFMVPVEEAVDPEWPEIMADVLAARKQAKPVRENPVLKERKARNCAAHLC